MNLTEAMGNLRNNPSEENNRIFAEYFRNMVDENAQVYTTAKRMGKGFAIDTAGHNGSNYCVMYSDSSFVESRDGSSACTIGISNLIDSVYANPHISGIVINPNAQPVFMQRKDLQIMSGKEDPRQKKKNWGKGIPKYTDSDLMVAEEGLEFAMNIVAEKGLEPEGYQLIEANNGVAVFPNFVCMKEAQLYYISVGCAVAPNVPRLDSEVVPKLLEIANEHHAKVLYAPVSFGSTDPERMRAGLVLNGDDFTGNFLGFLEIYIEKDA